jgi:type IV pilus assembly protein PilB
MPAAGSTIKVQNDIRDINQSFKERDIQEKAKTLDIPYVNLILFPINPDFSKYLSQEDSQNANAAIFFKSGKKIKLAVTDPDKQETKELLEKMKTGGYEVTFNLCSEESLKDAQKIYFTSEYIKHKKITETTIEEKDLGTFVQEIENLEQLKNKIEAATYEEALNYIQVGGYKTKSSDIHFQPEENQVLVRFRIDGVLRPVFYLSRQIYEGLLKQIKFLSQLKLNITKVPQDGQYNFIVNKRRINVRVSMIPSNYGETCVMRLLDSKKTFERFENLGFEGEALQNMKECINLPHGMILVTGPTGSGKTTTMYSMLQSIDTKAKKIITLEDPVEYNLDGITQSQVNSENDYSFIMGLRAILRQDPDVIMIGEIRDTETAETAAQASLTGHLVISTLHTNSAVEAIPRLVNMGVKSFILAPALDLIVAQRLVRVVCPDCAKERQITDKEREHFQQVLESVKAKGFDVPEISNTIKETKGCDKCGNTGFTGQIAIVEVLRFNQELRNLILENKSMPEIYDYINKNLRMISMHEDGILKVIRGITTLEEVYRVAAL